MALELPDSVDGVDDDVVDEDVVQEVPPHISKATMAPIRFFIPATLPTPAMRILHDSSGIPH
ncbi:hypothetical protein [Streptomyces sp. NBC_01262]|uniref:hypothetical protein n=1 Tax=Streptomyces sp. NBC_01262 TaxID=2903803 RepID=UPI002E2F818A|nr:hypothetical protein [Streptomyces sp. NBC_01262]